MTGTKLPEDQPKMDMEQEEARATSDTPNSKRDAPLLKAPNSPELYVTGIKMYSGTQPKTNTLKMKTN